MRKFVILAAHASTAIKHEHNLLVALILVLPGDGCTLACGGLPVDLAKAVALAKFTQLVKFQPQSTPLVLAYSQLAEPVIHTQ